MTRLRANARRTLWLRGRIDLGPEQPIWFNKSIPTGPESAVEMVTPDRNTLCRIYVDRGDVPEARKPVSRRSQNIAVFRLHSVLRVSADAQAVKEFRSVQERPNAVWTASARQLLRDCYQGLHSAVNQLIVWLRDGYGQYWLQTLPSFVEPGQQFGNIASFFAAADVEWSVYRRKWRPLRISVFEATAVMPNIEDLLSRKDWAEISARIHSRPDLTLHLLSKAKASLDSGDHRSAVITAITAIEHEVLRYVQRRLSEHGLNLNDKVLGGLMKETGLSFLLSDLVPALGNTEVIDLVPDIQQANNTRNQLVHGRQRDVDASVARDHLKRCEQFVGKLLPPEVRLRRIRSGRASPIVIRRGTG